MGINFNESANDWFNTKKNTIKAGSLSCYYTILFKGLIPYFENKEINNKTIQEYVLHCTHVKMYSNKTVKDHLKILKYVLRDVLHKNEFDVEYPTILEMRKTDSKAFSVSDIKKIRQYTVDNLDNPHCLAILFGLSLGLRIGEVTGLKFSDIDFNNKTVSINRTSQRIQVFSDENSNVPKTKIHVGSPKTKSSKRKLPVSDLLLDAINYHSKYRDADDFIFRPKYKDAKEPLDTRVLREAFRRILNTLNIQQLPFHSLRHSFASNCISSDVDVKTTSAMLGHSDVKITLEVYTHPSFEQKKDAITKLSKLFN